MIYNCWRSEGAWRDWAKSADFIWQANQASNSFTTMPCAVPGKFSHNVLHADFLAMYSLWGRICIYMAGFQNKARLWRIGQVLAGLRQDGAGLENPITKLTGLWPFRQRAGTVYWNIWKVFLELFSMRLELSFFNRKHIFRWKKLYLD